MDAPNLHRRMKKIMGQLNAIDKMIDEDVPCEDILIQINAAKSALHKVGQVVLEGHLNHCVRDGIEHGDADKDHCRIRQSHRTFLPDVPDPVLINIFIDVLKKPPKRVWQNSFQRLFLFDVGGKSPQL